VKIFLLFGLALVIVTYARAMIIGRRVARVSRELVPSHQSAARMALWTMAAYVVAIEVCARITGGAKYDLLFWVHLACALSSATIMVLLIARLDGLRWRLHHAKLAYGSLFFSLGMYATGLALILGRF
jgi:hypothetical protein